MAHAASNLVILLNAINKFPNKDDRKKIYYSKSEKWKKEETKQLKIEESSEQISFQNRTEEIEQGDIKNNDSLFYHYKHKTQFEYVPKPVCDPVSKECNYDSIIKMDWTLDQQKQRICDALKILSRFYKLEGIDVIYF